MAWEEMAWKETVAPSSLQDVILLHIPKPGKLLPVRLPTISSLWGVLHRSDLGNSFVWCCPEGSHLPPGAVVEQNALRHIGLQKLLRQLTSRLRDALIASLHSGLHGWINLWVGINGHILASPIRGHTGIPQLNQNFANLVVSFLEALYVNVDDRIVLTDIPDLIESAIHAWHIFALKRKLIENTGKLQKVA